MLPILCLLLLAFPSNETGQYFGWAAYLTSNPITSLSSISVLSEMRSISLVAVSGSGCVILLDLMRGRLDREMIPFLVADG